MLMQLIAPCNRALKGDKKKDSEFFYCIKESAGDTSYKKTLN